MRIPSACLALPLAALSLLAGDRVTGRAFATRSEVAAQHGMACTSQPLVTQIALDILKQGGSAVDAAIAANAALGLMEPTGSGIGGDLFAIVWDAKTKKLYGLNGSGRSPKSLTLDHFKKLGLKHIPPHGPLPVSVPGCVDGWFELHERFGKLPMAQVLAPAIRYARKVSRSRSSSPTTGAAACPSLGKYPGFLETFSVDGKRGPASGEVFRNPRLAKTLELLAKDGRDAFYKGEIARKIDAYMKANGGFLSYEDLAAHHSRLGRARQRQLPRLRRLGAAAQRPGHRRPADAQHPRGLRLLEDPASAARSTCTCSSRPRSWPSRTARSSTPTPPSSKVPVAGLLSKDYAAQRRALIDEPRLAPPGRRPPGP